MASKNKIGAADFAIQLCGGGRFISCQGN